MVLWVSRTIFARAPRVETLLISLAHRQSHHTWSTGEICQVVMEKKALLEGQIPKSMASMKLGELINACQNAGITLPSKPTRAAPTTPSRDVVRPGKAVVSFQRHRGKLFSEVPESYLRWRMKETDANGENSSLDLARLANYARDRFKEAETAPQSPMIPPMKGYVLSKNNPKENAKGSPNRTAPPTTTSAPKKRGESDKGSEACMEQDVPPEAKEEIEELMTRLACLRDKYNV